MRLPVRLGTDSVLRQREPCSTRRHDDFGIPRSVTHTRHHAAETEPSRGSVQRVLSQGPALDGGRGP